MASSKYGPPRKGTAEEYAAYRKGLCVDCKKQPYSAGRTRCNSCHSKYERGIL